MVGQCWTASHDLRDTGGRFRLTISQTAGPVEQKSRRDGKAHPAAHGAEVIKAPPGKQVLINRIGWETGDRCLAKHEGSAVVGSDALDVRLDADDPTVVELPIVADLATANEAINFRGDAAARERGRCYAKWHAATESGIAKQVSGSRSDGIVVAPSPAGIEADIGAGPGEDRRRGEIEQRGGARGEIGRA